MIMDSLHDFRIKGIEFNNGDIFIEFTEDEYDNISIFHFKDYSFMNLNSDNIENIISEAYIFSFDQLISFNNEYIIERYKKYYNHIDKDSYIFLVEPIVGIELIIVCKKIILMINGRRKEMV